MSANTRITDSFFELLEGTWQNTLSPQKIKADSSQWRDNFGWQIIGQPKAGEAGQFEFSFDRMRETITFKPLSGAARNVGVSGEEGFWRSMKYDVEIINPSLAHIHQEVGHFLMKVIKKQDGNFTSEAFEGNILRQASIPRANAMLTSGVLSPKSAKDFVDANQQNPFYNATPSSSDNELQQKVRLAFDSVNRDIIGSGGPDFTQTTQFIIDTDPGTKIKNDWEFDFRINASPSEMVSGQRVNNHVSIGNLLSDFWIGSRLIDGVEREILQYTQQVDIHFNGTIWPHVAVNTLIKVAV